MGIDWFRMRPKPEASRGELARLIREQAVALQEDGGHWRTWLHVPEDEMAKKEAHARYCATCAALRSLLDIAQYPEDELPDFTVCWHTR